MEQQDENHENLRVMPYGFVPDWFMDATEDDSVDELDAKSQRRYELGRELSEITLRHLVAYMKENDIVFAVRSRKDDVPDDQAQAE